MAKRTKQLRAKAAQLAENLRYLQAKTARLARILVSALVSCFSGADNGVFSWNLKLVNSCEQYVFQLFSRKPAPSKASEQL